MMKKFLIGVIAISAVYCASTGCKGKQAEVKPVNGTMEELVGPDSVPESVSTILHDVEQNALDERFEAILEDKDNNVSVWGLMKCSDDESSQGYGVVVMNDKRKTSFAIRHGNMPKAYFDKTNGNLWFSGAVSEGTGILVERPYLMRFDEEGKAQVVASIDPYEMQQALIDRLTYSVDGQDITLYINKKPVTTVKSTVQDMGDLFDDAIWIGEQLYYTVGKKLTVHFTPGVSYTVGKVLIYDDMPTIAATVDLTPEGFSLKDFRLVKED